jgi:ankyrin repeat protein
MRTLIKAGADTSRADNEGYAGIHNVAASQSSGNFLTLKLLVEEGQVDVDLPLRPAVGADTPLKKALVYGNSESADYLLAQGASASSSNKFGTSIFRHIFDGATSEGLEDPIGWLKKVLAKGARPTIEDVISLFALISNNDIDDE